MRHGACEGSDSFIWDVQSLTTDHFRDTRPFARAEVYFASELGLTSVPPGTKFIVCWWWDSTWFTFEEVVQVTCLHIVLAGRPFIF